ncbi:MAG TPA: alpha/beta fold hydrolase [Candidatus Lokiarchaeia archaeon]|nr:alpha/beta fold hydrolase [Candidatus Lokiarchaeia archaeon]
MLTPKQTRVTVLIVLVAAASGMGYYLAVSGGAYVSQANAVQDAQANLFMELVHTTASDGTPLKGILMASPDAWAKQDHSVPFIILCHGMSGSMYELLDLQYSLVQAGYVTLNIEFRGHSSNPAPSTLGTAEPWDILTFFNWVEQNVPCVNVSQSGIFGASMGGLYATLAYIFESQGRGRFKALVDLYGPNNITREVDFLTNNPNALGDLAFTGNLTGKNPVNYVNSTWPVNVLVAHGTADTTVSYNCSVDFVNKLDPTHTRSDVKFITVAGAGHGFGGEIMFNESIAWFDQKVLGKNTQPTDVKQYSFPVDVYGAIDSQSALLYASIFAVLVIAALVYLAKPSLYRTKQVKPKPPNETEKSSEMVNYAREQEWNGPPWLQTHRGAKLAVFYLVAQFAAGIVEYFLPMYILFKLAVNLGVTLIFLFFIMKWTKPASIDGFMQWVNPSAAIVWVASIAIGLSLYFFIPAIPALEDTTLVVGPRITWYIPAVTAMLVSYFVSLILIARLLIPTKMGRMKRRLAEAGTCGALFGGMFFVAFIWGIGTYLYMPFLGHLTAPIVPLIASIFFAIFALFDLAVQVAEVPAKTVVPGAVVLTLVITILIGSSHLIFFY